MKPDLVLVNAGELVTMGAEVADDGGLGQIVDGAMAVKDGRVAWVGTTRQLRRLGFEKGPRTVDAKGRLVTPGFVDSHTHLLFAGSREDEQEKKALGVTYMKILTEGGGILRTMRETSKASVRKLVAEGGQRLSQLLRNGVTTVEVKTGYGEDCLSELRMLRAIRALATSQSIELVPTFLGLHAKSPRFRSSGEFTDYVVRDVLPKAAEMGPAFSDCFLEDGAFSRAECERYLKASKALGLKLKIHADEFGDSGGAQLAARLGCVSADHLVNSDEKGIESMARSGVVATLLPSTAANSSIPFARAREIMSSGCTVALGTDLSPNSWVESPQLVMSLACNGMKMTAAEALRGFTAGGAAALARGDIGRLTPGAKADFVIHDLESYRQIPYKQGGAHVTAVYKEGSEVFTLALG